MSISLYEASVPQFVGMLGRLSSILEKARVHSENKNIDASVLMNARLAPDMYPLSQQIQIVIYMAKACTARLAGQEVPGYQDDQSTFTGFGALIAQTITYLQRIDNQQIDGGYDRIITIKMKDEVFVYTGQDYLLDVIIPHFYFHVTTAYAILRHQGVEVDKKDYIGHE